MSSWVSLGKISIPMRRVMAIASGRVSPRGLSDHHRRWIFNLLIASAPGADRTRPLALHAQETALFAVPGALLQRLALVAQFLAAGERQLDLRPPPLVEVELERHDGHALPLDAGGQLVDLALVQEQPARLFWCVVVVWACLLFLGV